MACKLITFELRYENLQNRKLINAMTKQYCQIYKIHYTTNNMII
jgi:hypothetical protein